MSSPPASVIQITYDGDDITTHVLFNTARFECQANAVPGTFSFTVKDEARTLFFTTGKEVYLYVDGIKMFGGIVMRVGRTFAFPVDDTTTLSSVKTRQWVIEGVDFNIWFDKRVIRNPANYKKRINTNGVHTDQVLIVNHLPNYIDVPPGVTISTANIEALAEFGERGNEEGVFETRYGWVNQGTPWRQQMDEFAARSAAVYYIDADKNLHYHGLETASVPWAFVDRAPNGNNRVACREITATEDGAMIVTDALVWGGLEVDETIYFARYPDPPADDEREQSAIDAQDTYGRWQLAEQRFHEGNTQNTTNLRARAIIMGPPGESGGQQGGLRYPLWRIGLTWFAHDVPRVVDVPQHIRPGNLVNVILYAMGTGLANPLVQFLPLRNMSITFPQINVDGKAWVKFQGEFGLSYSDSRHLWRFLLAKSPQITQFRVGSVTNTSTESSFGSWASLTPNEAPDGARTAFNFPFPLLPSTTKVFVNGLLWRNPAEYSFTGEKQITFRVALAADDQVHVEARTGQG